ncbi:MAG: bifunctional oligoribonuclease/PAP phosphatase NrnA [Anaerococcus sp.]|uniref:DHH family phosphoesterase n=1 Tax=Anaerococcus sp. TaxID=1872515 RepID=UPI002622F5EA|nr:bifunctional oligoribonuclease/PAP phosphatase NrnA [Anaerococcus sp.]MCI5972446.1 bifunctional oligoribonuclease/PAP phosphatase NrnA [Anaerococcus sp.]
MKKEKISKDKLDKFKELVDNAETIAIASHINPDGDNLGSTLALRKSLELYGKDVELLANDTIDDYLHFLPEKEYYKEATRDSYDLFMILDCSEFDRIGDNLTPIAKASKNTLVIDHHVGGGIDTDLNLIYDTAPATCELVFEIIDRLDLPIDKDIASLIYTGLCTDTNRFLYSNVTEYTFYVAGRLLSLGADSEYIYRNLYQSKPMKVMKFQTEVISNAEFMDKKAYSIISKDLVKKHGVQMGDAETIVGMLRDIDEVGVSMILKEYDNGEYKVSLRSKDVDVAKVARENGGGGHIKASGFSIFDDSLEAASKKAIAILKEIDV